MDFVERLKDIGVAFVFESVGDLSPDGGNLLFGGFVYFRVVGGFLYVEPVSAVGAIVVDVDYHVHACIFSVAGNFRHAVEPGFVDGVGGGFAELAEPGYGDAHGLYARCSDGIEEFLGGSGVAPGCLVGHAVYVCIHLVAQVPAQTERLGHFEGSGCGFLLGGSGFLPYGHGGFVGAAADGKGSFALLGLRVGHGLNCNTEYGLQRRNGFDLSREPVGGYSYGGGAGATDVERLGASAGLTERNAVAENVVRYGDSVVSGCAPGVFGRVA